jgi:hypothetical protein
VEARQRTKAVLVLTLLCVTLWTLGGPGRAAGSAKERSHHAASLPAYLSRTIHAIPLPALFTSIPDLQPVGTLVPGADITVSASDGGGLRFGLAVFPSYQSATYPAISGDGGATWRIDGPCFWVAAADGPAETSSVGALGPDGAFFWGEGGDVVKITTDGGLRWSATGFGDGVYSVRAAHGTLRTVALGNQVKGGAGGAFGAFLYISTDAGRTWKLHGVLPDVRE